MRGRRAFVLVAAALGAIAAVVGACETFEEAPPSANEDGGGPDGTVADAIATEDVVIPDAPSDGTMIGPGDPCEVLVGQPYTNADAIVTALAADGLNVYWCDATGTTRQTTADAGADAEAVFRGVGTCTDVALGDFVAGRFTNNLLRVRSKTDLVGDATVPNESTSSVGIDPRNANAFFSRRSTGVFSCPLGTGCTSVIDQNNVTGIVTAPAGFDFMATSGARTNVYHCEGNCKGADAATQLLASASDALATKLVSDESFIYFLDRTAGILRKVLRTGGTAIDVITGLVEPIDVAIDLSQRLVVATAGNGLFRGPKTGCIAKPPAAVTNVTAMAVFNNTVWYSEGAAIKRVDP